MLKRTFINLLGVIPCCSAVVATANDNVVKFDKWQVNYNTEVVSMTKDNLHSNWIVKPPIILEAVSDDTDENAPVEKVNVYMQGYEGKCADLTKSVGNLKGTKFFISDSIVGNLYESYSEFNNNVVSNIFALVKSLDSKVCLKLYFYNSTETKYKLGFDEHGGGLGARVFKNIISSAKLAEQH